jgi:hypothetical protein
MKKFVVFPIILLSIFSCKNKQEINKNIVLKCVITDVKQYQSRNTLEFLPYYKYETECGPEITSHRGNVYNVGDTITYVYINRDSK